MAAYTSATPPPKLRENRAFVAFLHDFLKRHVPKDPGAIIAAKQQGGGFVYFIDEATPDGIFGRVPVEDIIGCFKVENGLIVANSFAATPEYLVYREGRGLIRLPGPIHSKLIEELRALPPCPKSR